MRASLEKWISDADAVRLLEQLAVAQVPVDLGTIRSRTDDYYIALVGELFRAMRVQLEPGETWSRLGNAFALFQDGQGDAFTDRVGVSKDEAAFFSAAAFYCGGFPASAYVALKSLSPDLSWSEEMKSCFDLIVRPENPLSRTVRTVKNAMLLGDLGSIESIRTALDETVRLALLDGPDEWIMARMLQALLERFWSAPMLSTALSGRASMCRSS